MNFCDIGLDRIDRKNSRKSRDERKRAELFDSIRQHGVKVPIIVYEYKSRFVVLDGNGRVEGSIEADKTTIPALVLDHAPTEGEFLLGQAIINSTREDFNIVDLAENYDALMRLMQWNGKQLAEQVNKSSATVTRILSLMKLSPAEREAMREFKVNSSAGYALVRMKPEQRTDYLARAANGQVSTRDTLNRDARKKPAKTAGLSRFVCTLPGSTVTVASKAAVTVELLISQLEEALRHCRRAVKEGWDASTLASVVRSKKAVS